MNEKIVNINYRNHKQLPVFVYGTLMTGHPNSYLLHWTENVRKAILKGFAIASLGSCPVIAKYKTDSIVYGELVDIAKFTYYSAMRNLDILECVAGGGYFRDIVKVKVGNKYIEAWVYRGDNFFPVGQIIESGSWDKFCKEDRV